MDEAHKKSDAYLKQVERRVQQEYSQAASEVQAKLEDYLQRYEIKNRIKLEKLNKGEITESEYTRWRTGQIMMGKRWEEMRDTLAQDLSRTNEIAASIVNGYLPEVYALNHNYGTYEAEVGALVDTSYTLYDRSTVERLMRSSTAPIPKARVDIPKDLRWNQRQVTSAVMQSILQGEGAKKAAKRVAKATSESNMHVATRNARTMITSAENAGRVDSYKRASGMGIKMEQVWLATLDGRTRHSHRQMDGVKIKVGGKFPNGCKYPGDPEGPAWEVYNCRCTLIGQVDGVDYNLSDVGSRNNYKLEGMTYDEWKHEHERTTQVVVPTLQSEIGRATTVDEINNIMNSQGWFVTNKYGITSVADLTGCDLESAKSIAASYQQVFDRYPKLKGKFGAPNAQPRGMSNNTYAWCYSRSSGKVQVNPNMYNSWSSLVKSYENDVASNWHPKGTTAESIVTHEIGHAIDGLLARERVLGGMTSSGEFRMASSSLKTKVMKQAAKIDPDIANDMDYDRMFKTSVAVRRSVSKYATTNTKEWFAECFAEYITSANPRTVAKLFGEELERLVEKLT